MYSPQSSDLVTNRGTRGLATILVAIAFLAVAVLSVAVVMAAAGTMKAQIGDHSLDAGENARASYVAADHRLDVGERNRAEVFLAPSTGQSAVDPRRVAFSKAHHSDPTLVSAASAVIPLETADSLRREHRPIGSATVQASPTAPAPDSTEALRREHLSTGR